MVIHSLQQSCRKTSRAIRFHIIMQQLLFYIFFSLYFPSFHWALFRFFTFQRFIILESGKANMHMQYYKVSCSTSVAATERRILQSFGGEAIEDHSSSSASLILRNENRYYEVPLICDTSSHFECLIKQKNFHR